MDGRPVVFALILGWISGHEQLSPLLSDWLTTRDARQLDTSLVVCRMSGVDFELRQVLLDLAPVSGTETGPAVPGLNP